MPGPAPTSNKAVTSLVLGILGLLFCAPIGVGAILYGNQAREEIAASGGRLVGDGLAQVGVVLGWIAVGLMAIGLLVAVVLIVLALVPA